MKSLQISAVLFCLYYCVNCYNINVKNIYLYSNLKDNLKDRSSYFGYSVLLHKRWVQVGAPRANSTHFGEKVMEPGVVYRCEIKGPCKEIIVDYMGNGERANLRSVVDNKNYSWIGGSMDMEAKEDGKVVVCGHRWKNQLNQFRTHSYAISGICYYSDNDNRNIFEPKFEVLLPLEVYSVTPFDSLFYGGVLHDSQIGTSISITQRSEDKISLLLGAPGAGPFWRGGVVQFESEVLGSVPARRKRQIHHKLFGDFHKLGFIWKVTISNLQTFSYFGYQVASGFFFNRRELNYATSSPRGADMKGSTLIYNIYYIRSQPYVSSLSILEGSTAGEYFGASLAVADINGDGLDELIVGSPLFSIRGDEGCIYVFSKYYESDILHKIDTKKGYYIGGRFGTSVASLGDIDQDSFEDIAVAAPYEENGVIYIYNGSPDGLSRIFSQQIKGSDIHPSLKGFGISISRPTDVDGNKYNDFVVGSYLSSHAVLFRTHPTVELNATLMSVSELQLNDTKIWVKACIKFVGSNAPKNINVVRTFDIDSDYRRFENIPPKYVTLQKTEMFECEELFIKKKKEHESRIDGLEDVKIVLSQKLNYEEHKDVNIMWMSNSTENKGQDKFCAHCPVMRKNHAAVISIPYSQQCEGRDCRSDVKLGCELFQENSLLGNKHPFYIIGSKPIIKLIVNISNFGDTLYSGRIKITIPKEVNLAQIPFICEDSYNNSLTVNCKLGAMSDKMTKQINISLQLSASEKLRSLSEQGQHLSFHVSTSSLKNHIDINKDNNVCNLKLDLKMDADVQIHGNSDKEWYTYENRETDSEEPRIEPKIVHTYEVSNVGISPIREVETILYVPTEWVNYRSLIKFVTFSVKGQQNAKSVLCLTSESKDVENQITKPDVFHSIKEVKINTTNISDSHPLNRTLFLNCSSPFIKCKEFICTFAEFTSYTHAKLVISMTLNVSLIEPLMGLKDIIHFSTYGHVQMVGVKKHNILPGEDDFHQAIVPSTVIGSVPDDEVAIWIIIICVIAGILLIALAVVGLMKAGFFRREKKEELKALMQSNQPTQQ